MPIKDQRGGVGISTLLVIYESYLSVEVITGLALTPVRAQGVITAAMGAAKACI